jgi:hypothetical protein
MPKRSSAPLRPKNSKLSTGNPRRKQKAKSRRPGRRTGLSKSVTMRWRSELTESGTLVQQKAEARLQELKNEITAAIGAVTERIADLEKAVESQKSEIRMLNGDIHVIQEKSDFLGANYRNDTQSKDERHSGTRKSPAGRFADEKPWKQAPGGFESSKR